MAERYRPFEAGSRVRLRMTADERLVKSIRRGDREAFEVLYDRHAASLLSFCLYMLGSRQDAEDAVQATFTSAYRSLLADNRPVNMRPWLFTIARNASLSILRRRQPTVELNGEAALTGDPQRELELRDEVRQLIAGLLALPERQRTTLTLAELHGLSHREIAAVLGVRIEQVKAFAYQARANLISERAAHETACHDIRRELETARGVALRKTRLYRHLRSCSDCQEYKQALSRQRQHLAALLPAAPSLALKFRAFHDMLGSVGLNGQYAEGAAFAGTAAAAGGGIKALVAKVAAGVVALGASAGVGAAVLDVPIVSEGQGSRASAGEALPRRSTVRPNVQGLAAAASQTARLGAGTPIGARRAGHFARLLLAGAVPDEGTSARRGSVPRAVAPVGEGEAPVTGRSVVSGLGEATTQKPQSAAEEERQRLHEASLRQRGEHERLREERQQLGAARAAKAEQERRQRHEERTLLGASKPPKSEEERRLQHERGRQRLEERKGLRGP